MNASAFTPWSNSLSAFLNRQDEEERRRRLNMNSLLTPRNQMRKFNYSVMFGSGGKNALSSASNADDLGTGKEKVSTRAKLLEAVERRRRDGGKVSGRTAALLSEFPEADIALPEIEVKADEPFDPMDNPLARAISAQDAMRTEIPAQGDGVPASLTRAIQLPPSLDRGDNTQTPPAMARMLQQLQQRQAQGQQFTGRTAELLQAHRTREAQMPLQAPQEALQSDLQAQASPMPLSIPESPQGQQMPNEQLSDPAQAEMLPTPPTNSLRSHIGDPGDALRMLREGAGNPQVSPVSAQDTAGLGLQPQETVSSRAPLPQAQQPAPQAGGILSGLFGGQGMSEDMQGALGDLFTGLAMGGNVNAKEENPLNASFARAAEQVALGNKQRLADRRARLELNATRRAAVKLGIPEDVAANSPMDVLQPLMTEVWKRRMEPPKTTDDMREYEFARSQGYQGSFADFQREMRQAGASQVNIDQKTEGAFDKKAAEKQAERFDTIAQDGLKADQMIADVNGLRDIATRITTGKTAEITAALGPYAEAMGVKIDGLGDLQAFEAVAARVAPSLRTPGVGAMSDYELRQFIKALPTLGKTPDGNKLIGDTLSAMAGHKKAAADLASRAINGEIDRKEADRLLRELPDPLTLFRHSQKGQARRTSTGVNFTVEPD